MPVVDFLPIANAGGAAVEDQASYAADATLPNGYQTGIVPQLKFNKSWRQVTMMMAAVANYISQQLAADVLDDGDLAGLVTKLTNAITTGANVKPAREVTASVALNLTTADYAVGLARTAAPAAMVVNLPAGAQVGQEFVIDDLTGNFNAFPVTVTPPGGDSIAGEATWVCNLDRGSWKFRRYPNNLWSVA
jgi:hypothetical protein